MKTNNFKGLVDVVKSFTKTHSPEILVGLGIAGMVTSTVLAVRATPKAVRKIESEIENINEQLLDQAVQEQRTEYSPTKRLKPGQVIKICWKDYLPATVTGVAAMVCIIGGTHINLRRNAALITACKLSEVTIKDLQSYKDKAIEVIGEEKHAEIEDKINKEALELAEKTGPAIIDMDSDIISGNGPILYFDRIGGQWFKSDQNKIIAAINRLNHTMNDDMYVSLNDLYDELGLSRTVAGDLLGWNRDHGLIEAKFTSYVNAAGLPVVILSTRLEPRFDYSSLH